MHRTYSDQEKRLNTFHLHCLERLLGIKWQDKIPNRDVLERTGLPSISVQSQHRLRWLVHIHHMNDDRIPKDLLYRELSEGFRSRGRPRLRYKDTCRRNTKSAAIRHPELGKPCSVPTSRQPLYNAEQNKLSKSALASGRRES
ncbi:uncharacterized protein [Penaeus vannamei]|uniref:uncharacterized protein n=1 Tax=Penaeus vannamei TaxID=6689 RepID=UPI00387F9731